MSSEPWAPFELATLAPGVEASHFFFERLLGLSFAARSRMGLSAAQANHFLRGVAEPFLPLMSAPRAQLLLSQRARPGAERPETWRASIDAIFSLSARSPSSAGLTLARLAQEPLRPPAEPMDWRFDEEPIEAASLPPQRSFLLLSQLLSSSAGDANSLSTEEQTHDFLKRYNASMGFLIGLCAEEGLMDWMPSAVNSICFSRLGWPEQWSSSQARRAYSSLYLGLLPRLARGFSEPETAFAKVLERCAPSYPHIERERSDALRQAAADETRRRLLDCVSPARPLSRESWAALEKAL